MKCNDDKKCICLTCENMKDCYCSYFKSNHMCDKCDWKGYVIHCPNKNK